MIQGSIIGKHLTRKYSNLGLLLLLNGYIYTMYFWLYEITSTVFYQLIAIATIYFRCGTTNQDFNISIVCKVLIYGFLLCTTWQLSEGCDYQSHGY